tara:strand:+ start:10096 stop:10236 length:141 start_codon:yes stop_codon:yes gene_type:complete
MVYKKNNWELELSFNKCNFGFGFGVNWESGILIEVEIPFTYIRFEI